MAAKQLLPGVPFNGVNLDLLSTEIENNLATDIMNMRPRENALERIFGAENVLSTGILDAPRHLQSVLVGQQNYWVYFGDTIIGATDGTSHFDLTHASGIAKTYDWTTDLINNFIVANNPDDNPMYWDGQTSNNFVDLPGWPANTKCQALRTFGTYLFALGIEDAAGTRLNEVAWSDEATTGDVPQSWTPTPTNDAGSRELGETEGVIVDADRLRNDLIIYKDFSTYRCSFVGGNDVFGFFLLYEDSGCLGRNCVVTSRNRHYVMTRDDIITHDGVNPPVSIADRRVRNYFKANLNESEGARAYAVNHAARNEIWFCFPETGSDTPTTALIYNVNEDSWGIRDITYSHIIEGLIAPPTTLFTWDTYSGTWDTATETWNENTAGTGELNLLAADEDNTKLVGLDTTEDNNGSDVTSKAVRTGLTMGDPQREKLVTAILPRITGLTGQVVRVRVGFQNNPSEAITWGSYQDYTIGTTERIDADTLGRYIALEFQNTSSNAWRLESFDIEYQMRGRHAV